MMNKRKPRATDELIRKTREQFLAERDGLRAEIRDLRKKVLIERAAGFGEGSAATLRALYSVAANDAVRLWISDMLKTSRNPRKPVNSLTESQNDEIVGLIGAMLARIGLSKDFLETNDFAFIGEDPAGGGFAMSMNDDNGYTRARQWFAEANGWRIAKHEFTINTLARGGVHNHGRRF
jgi:hypothetical protein